MDVKQNLESYLKEIEDLAPVLVEQQRNFLLLGNSIADLKKEISVKYSSHLIGGNITGKNQEMREAEGRTLLLSEYTHLESLEKEWDNLKVELEHSRLVYEILRFKVRIIEQIQA